MSSSHNIAIKLWIEMLTGYANENVFLGQSNGDKPNTDYAVFTFLSGETSDYSLVELVKEDDVEEADERITHRDRPIYQIDIFADNGRSILNKLWASKGTRQARAILKAGGLTLSQKSIVRNIPNLGDTGYLPRYSCDFTFLAEETLSTKDDLNKLVGLWENYKIKGNWKSKTDIPVEITS